MALTLGPLTERLVIQTRTETADTQGGRAVTWATLDEVWAAFDPQSASERLQAESLGSQQSLRFRVRRRADVTPTMRVSWTPTWPKSAAARTLEIASVVPIDDGRTWMFIQCGERT